MNWVCPSKCTRRVAESAALGTGTGTRVRVATPRVTYIALRSQKSYFRTGTGVESSQNSRRSYPTSTTSRIASNLRRDIQFNTRVTSARFLEDTNLWEVQTDQGDRVTARYLITGIGCLSASNVPHIKGLDTFEGEWHHTGNWPHDIVDFTGKAGGSHWHGLKRRTSDTGDCRAS